MRGRNTRRHQCRQRGEEVRGARPQGGSRPPVSCSPPAGTPLAHAELSKEKGKLGRRDVGFSPLFHFFFLVAKQEGWLKRQASLTLRVPFQNPAPPILSPFAAPTWEMKVKSNWGEGYMGAGNPR